MYLGRALILSCGLASSVSADSLADMRQDLAGLLDVTRRLQLDIVATLGGGPTSDGSLLGKAVVIENELRRLTGQTEDLAYRISVVVRDINQRITSLDARVCALEPGCAVTGSGEAMPIVSQVKKPSDLARTPDTLTVSEQSEFDLANTMLISGDTLSAVQMFEDFIIAFPIGPLTQKAHLFLGHGYMDISKFRLAARSYLEAYSVDEENAVASSALYNLALAFHRMGNTEEGCLTLNEVQFRYSNSDIVADAKQAAVELSCI
mgnify:CR=1 FL=1